MEYKIKFESRDEPVDDKGEEIDVYGIDVGLIDIYSNECEECEGIGKNDGENECTVCEGSGEVEEHLDCEGEYDGIPIRVRKKEFISEDGYSCGHYDYYIVNEIPFDYEIDGFPDWKTIKSFDTRKKAFSWIEDIPKITYSEVIKKGWIINHENECEDCGNDLEECECEDGEYKRYHSNGQIKAHYHIENLIKKGESKEWYENGKLKEFRIETALLRQSAAWNKDGEACAFWSKKRANVKEEFQDDFEKQFNKDWHDNGQLSFVSNNKGIFRWYKDGSKKTEDLYREDYKGYEPEVLVLKDGKKYLFERKKYISRKSWDESGKLNFTKIDDNDMEDSYKEYNDLTEFWKFSIGKPLAHHKDITAINVKSNIEYKISSDLRITDLPKGAYILDIYKDYTETIDCRKLIVE